MASQGPNAPSSGANDTSIGAKVWSNPGNILVQDAAYAEAIDVTSSVVSNYLTATGFGFSIPSGATIDGITVDILKMRVAGGIGNARDNSIKIIQGGVISGVSRANAINWPTTFTYVTYGSSSDLWGVSWTDTDINASNFGIAISGRGTGAKPAQRKRLRVDFVRITIDYTGGGAPFVAQRSVQVSQAVNRASRY